MARSYSKSKGRSGGHKSFAGVPRIVMDSPDYINLSAGAKNLLWEFARQYRGSNNGDLTAAHSVVHPRGCGAKDTVTKSVKRLLAANLIIQTREGVFSNPGAKCSLYAFTWEPINECKGKQLDIQPTTVPLRNFYKEKNNKTPCPETRQGSSQKLGREGARNTKGQWQSSQKLGR